MKNKQKNRKDKLWKTPRIELALKPKHPRHLRQPIKSATNPNAMAFIVLTPMVNEHQ